MRLFAWGLLASMLAAALHDVSRAWDVWYYHLPFAARIAGIVPASEYAYDAMNQARFDGFPLLGEALQGLLWRVTGRPECANLVAFATLPLFAWFMRRRFDVPMHVSIIALLAVPLVQIHATSCYVDLPANTAATIVVMIAIGAWAERDDAPSDRMLVLAIASAIVAANMKAMMQPIVLVALLALGARIRHRRRVVVIGALLLPIVFATPLKNLIVHHNPYYPVALEIFGRTLPGPDDPYSSSPVWLEHAPRPIRFACSVLELGVRSLGDTKRWTVDQWTPPEAPGYRMGGFFGLYVIVHIILLAWRAVRERADRVVRVAALGVVLVTAMVSVLPQSHELRYYMTWMMTLVSVNVWLARRSKQEAPQYAYAAALALVLVLTRGAYAYPSGESFRELVHTEVSDAALGKALGNVHDGERVCVEHPPWNFLWAARFHAPRAYAVTEGCTATPSL